MLNSVKVDLKYQKIYHHFVKIAKFCSYIKFFKMLMESYVKLSQIFLQLHKIYSNFFKLYVNFGENVKIEF